MGKVTAGFFSFTEITDPAEHRSYNEWHQLDHMPEQYPLAGVVSGQRWVCTPACRAARAAAVAPLDRVHYLTLYLMAEPLAATLAEFAALAERLAAAGRFHQHRRALLSGPLALAGAVAAPRVAVSAEAVPHRPNQGVYVVVEPRDPGAAGGPDDLAALSALDGVAGAWRFVPEARGDLGRWPPGSHEITVCYLDEDPRAVARTLRPVLTARWARTGVAPLLSGPFETITPWAWDWFDDPGPGAGAR